MPDKPKNPKIDLESYYSAWQYQYKVVGAIMPGLSEEEQQKVYEITKTSAWAYPWHEILPLYDKIMEPQNSALAKFDSIETILNMLKSIAPYIEKMKALVGKMNTDNVGMKNLVESLDKTTPIYTECDKLYRVGDKTRQFLNHMMEWVIDAKRMAEDAATPNERSQVEIPSLSKYEKNQLINDILDAYNSNKLSMDQMNARMSELTARNNVTRTITGFGNISIPRK